MKIIESIRENGSKKVAIEFDQPSLTDQSSKNLCDINVIVENYRKTGVLPNFREKLPQYIDMTQFGSYMDTHELIMSAREMFMELPSKVRKAMHNNPANLEAFVKDPNNYDLLLEYGLIEPKGKDIPNTDPSKPEAEAKPKKSEAKA